MMKKNIYGYKTLGKSCFPIVTYEAGKLFKGGLYPLIHGLLAAGLIE
jgi:hypothetical protein